MAMRAAALQIRLTALEQRLDLSRTEGVRRHCGEPPSSGGNRQRGGDNKGIGHEATSRRQQP
jgi:hypothetical protein